LLSFEKCKTYTRVLWSWKDFPVNKNYGIPFDAHLFKSLIHIVLANFSTRNGDLFSLKRLNDCPRLMVYIHMKIFCTWAYWKSWLLKFRLRCRITLFCSEFYVTSNIIHLTQHVYKTYSVKQMWASVLLKLNIKPLFGIKHITQKNDIP